jgi:hypothetical protein
MDLSALLPLAPGFLCQVPCCKYPTWSDPLPDPAADWWPSLFVNDGQGTVTLDRYPVDPLFPPPGGVAPLVWFGWSQRHAGKAYQCVPFGDPAACLDGGADVDVLFYAKCENGFQDAHCPDDPSTYGRDPVWSAGVAVVSNCHYVNNILPGCSDFYNRFRPYVTNDPGYYFDPDYPFRPGSGTGLTGDGRSTFNGGVYGSAQPIWCPPSPLAFTVVVYPPGTPPPPVFPNYMPILGHIYPTGLTLDVSS